MDKPSFTKFLTSSGKKAHVIEDLVKQVEAFEIFLSKQHKSLDTATPQDLQAYASILDAQQPGRASKQVRGIILYYRFTGKPELALAAQAIREEGTIRTRRIFPLKDFRGIDPQDITRLAVAGITNVEQMLQAGQTPESRQRLAETSGISPATILELVKLSDLSRLGGLKGIRARLYYEAGADTPEKIAQWQPEDLQKMLAEFVDRASFPGIAPLPKEVFHTVEAARQLAKLIIY